MADILPEPKRQEGFGIMRVAFNFAWIFGAALGGLIAARSFLALFILDAVLSTTVGIILFFTLPETQPVHHKEAKKNEPFFKTVSDYRLVLRDAGYIAFIVTGIIYLLVYQQQYGSLSVYLRDQHGINSQIYGILLAIAGFEVVLFQIGVSRIIRKYQPFLVITLGTFFFLFGFSMIGFVHGVALFLVSILLITLGEMITFPTNRVIAAAFAPEDMRGRYMAVYDLGWTLPATFGPAAAGLILDHYDPNLLWYIGGLLCGISALGFYILHLRLGTQPRFQPTAEE